MTSSTFIPSFISSEFKSRFGDDIVTRVHHFNTALEKKDFKSATQEYGHISDILETARTTNATHDICQTEKLLVRLAERVSKMSSRPSSSSFSSSSSSSASSAAAAAGSASAVVRSPIGIRRLGNNCGFNALGQFFAGAPGIAKEFKSESFLASLMQQYSEAKGAVDHSFGQNFRAWMSANLTGVDATEWRRERNYLDSNQIDVLAPLHFALEEAGFGFDLVPITMLAGLPMPKDPEEAAPSRPKDRSIPLQLSTKERDFKTLFRSFFNLPADPYGLSRHYQFQETPEDLIVEVHRFRQLGTTRSKMSDPLQEVPRQFTLDPKFTEDKSSTTTYLLSGCILHTGSLNGGHYTFLRRVGDKWYLCDDHVVTEVKDPSTLIAQAYVYHFEKVQDETKRSAPPALPASAAAAAAGGSPAGPIVAVQKSFAEACLRFAIGAIGSCVGFVFKSMIGPVVNRIDAALRTKPTKID